MLDHEQSTSVLIVGGGPTGLLASILLSRCGVSHILVERRLTTLTAPAAHVVNTRTMEIYRQAGLSVDELYALNTHPNAHLVAWKDRLEHPALGVFNMAKAIGSSVSTKRISSEHTTNISQHRLEAHLRQHAEASAFADIRFGAQWVEFVDEDKQKSLVRADGGAETEIEYEYMIAADGAGSSIANALSVKKLGPDAIATLLNLTCEVDTSAIAGDQDTLLYWLLDPDVQGTVIVHDPKALAVYMRPIAVPYESVDDYDDARCNDLLKQVFGDQPFEVRHKGVWKMTAQVADQFRIGPVFLAGDAAHRFPPTGGLGLNTGVGDVHNLVWKLAAALNADASQEALEGLLDTYELERRPVAQTNCDVSRRNNAKMGEVVGALGLDPAKAQTIAKVMHSKLVTLLPASLRSKIYQWVAQPVKASLDRARREDEQGEEIRARVHSAIDNQREHFSSIGLDLGYVYREGVGVAPDAQYTQGSEVSTYTESLGPGARLPYRSFKEDASLPAAFQGSLHDRIDYTRFTMLCAGEMPTLDFATFGIPCQTITIPREAFDLETNGWLLIRPDGHVMAMG